MQLSRAVAIETKTGDDDITYHVKSTIHLLRHVQDGVVSGIAAHGWPGPLHPRPTYAFWAARTLGSNRHFAPALQAKMLCEQK